MSAADFFIAHGEKLALVVVIAGCAYALWTTLDDPEIRPLDDLGKIEEKNEKIAAVFKKQDPPKLREPRRYLDEMLSRVAEAPTPAPVMAWLTTPPDKGRGDAVGSAGSGLQPYIYELHPPQVMLEDAIGTLRVTITLPDAKQLPNRPRVSAQPEQRWERDDKTVNSARYLGVQLQLKIGDGPWQPWVLPGASADGVLPIARISASPMVVDTPEPWQTHRVRARLIAAATALDLEGAIPERPRYTVLVYPGASSPSPAKDAEFLDQVRHELRKKEGALWRAFLRPIAPLAGVQLGAQERCFAGPWSNEAKVEATDSVRFAFVGITTQADPNDPTKTREVGRFLLLRLFEQGGERKWLDKPIEERFAVQEVIRKTDVTVANPFGEGRIKASLQTPFRVKRLLKEQRRVLYWQIRAVAGSDGKRRLQLEKKEVSTEIAEVENPATKTVIVLTRLATINPPSGRDVVIYPHRTVALNERDEFVRAPSEFRQWGLVPQEPQAHQPDTGPLAELYQAKIEAKETVLAQIYKTDTDYYSLADGRIVWWDPLNKVMRIHDPEGVMASKETAPPPPTPPPGAGTAAPSPAAGTTPPPKGAP
ncbi:MAG: hypothetical protein NZ552_08265 [Planctomycetes bacterium]|nr:hypothetical protein [Planctomycetota bacterium]